MLIELTLIFSTYGSLRFWEHKKTKIKQSKLRKKAQKKLTVPDEALKTIAKKELNIAYLNLGLSFVFPSLYLLNSVLLVRSSYSYLYSAEKSLREKKISNDILGAGWVLSAALSRQFLAGAIGNIIYHLGTNFIEKTRNQSEQELLNLFDYQNKKVWLVKESVEIETSLEAVLLDDIVVVNSSDMMPVDGVIVSGQARLDEHVLTGESQAVEKQQNDAVFASTLVVSGTLHVKVTKAGDDTAVAKIEKVLNKTTDFKTDLQLKGEAWADKSAPYFLGAAGLAAATVGFVPASAILTANFGYHLRMMAPLNTLQHLKHSSDSGILIKDGRSLECLINVDTILFDKTGTLTTDQPEVNQVLVWGEYDKQAILRFAALAEFKLKHPIAKAILNAYAVYDIPLKHTIDEADYVMGFGTKITLNQQVIRVGSLNFMKNEGLNWQIDQQQQLEPIYQQGHSIVLVSVDDNIIGAIEIKPTLRPEIPALIEQLKQQGIQHLMIVSGDQEQPTQQLAKQLGIEYIAEVLPENKAKIVTEQQQQGRKVCFIGDGINDTIAMKQADVSISLQGASTIATDTADIILLQGDLSVLNQLFNISFNLDSSMKITGVMVIVPTGVILFSSLFFPVGLLAAMLIKAGGLSANAWYILKK